MRGDDLQNTLRELLSQSLTEEKALPSDFSDKMSCYGALLLEWNERMNLTAITDPKEVVEKHFLDSLSPLKAIREALLLPKKGAAGAGAVDVPSLIDIGTGAGFPGMILAAALPDVQVTLLDSLTKRLTFLDAVKQELGLSNVTLVNARAEEAAHERAHRERYDVAVARAVAGLNVLLEYTGGYVKSGGKLFAYKGPRFAEELEMAKAAMKILSMKHAATIDASREGEERYIGVFEKTVSWDQKPATLQYPRKQSKIKHQPLSF